MILSIVAWACFGYLLVVAEPVIMIKRWFGFKEEEYDEMSYNMRFFHRLLYCSKCLTFWVTILFTFDPVIAVISSVLAGLIEKIIY